MRIRADCTSIVIVVMVALALGCNKDTATNDDAVGSGRLYGTVTDHFKLEPVSGAIVSVAGRTSIADGGGEYSIEDVPTGDFAVVASADGYDNYTASVTMSESQYNRHNIEMRPTRNPGTGAIWGYVYKQGTNLEKICGVRVYVSAGSVNMGDTSSGYLCSFYIYNIPPGWYSLIAMADGYKTYARDVHVQADSTILGAVLPLDSIQ